MLSHMVREFRQEGDDIVLGFPLDLIDPGDPLVGVGLVAAGPNRRRRFFRNDTKFR